MNVYDRLEKAGHDPVLVNGLQAGVSTYVCENCGALIKLRNDEVILFHLPPNSPARQALCERKAVTWSVNGTLRSKLKKLDEEDMERFKQAMED